MPATPSAISRASGVLALAALVSLALLQLTGCAAEEMHQEMITLGEHELLVWVAETQEQHIDGLQAVPPITDGEGMLFVWDEPSERTFSLKDVEYEIDVVFVDTEGRVLDVDTIGPGGALVAESAQIVGWVVEVPGGWAEGHDVMEGSKLVIGGGP